MDKKLIEKIKAEAKAFAIQDTVIRQDCMRRNPNSSPEGSIEQESRIADAVLGAPFLKDWYRENS